MNTCELSLETGDRVVYYKYDVLVDLIGQRLGSTQATVNYQASVDKLFIIFLRSRDGEVGSGRGRIFSLTQRSTRLRAGGEKGAIKVKLL